tara:strand:+ start:269 stop:445 length:177 start_codon:yes stop_codon:yes gene_type:complete
MVFVVGGSGGSGTRLVAQTLQAAGCDIGAQLNASLDALDFKPILERYVPKVLAETGSC